MSPSSRFRFRFRIVNGMHTQFARLLRGEAPFWIAWWLFGIPVIAFATWLGMLAEDFRYDDEHFTGAMLDTIKLLVCLFWLIVAWRCSANVSSRFWLAAGRLAVFMALAILALIY